MVNGKSWYLKVQWSWRYLSEDVGNNCSKYCSVHHQSFQCLYSDRLLSSSLDVVLVSKSNSHPESSNYRPILLPILGKLIEHHIHFLISTWSVVSEMGGSPPPTSRVLWHHKLNVYRCRLLKKVTTLQYTSYYTSHYFILHTVLHFNTLHTKLSFPTDTPVSPVYISAQQYGLYCIITHGIFTMYHCSHETQCITVCALHLGLVSWLIIIKTTCACPVPVTTCITLEPTHSTHTHVPRG